MKTIRFALILLLAAFVFFGAACDEDEDCDSSNAPADHNVSEDGTCHLPGLQAPEDNCTACHGDELRGGETAPSCYSCHGKEW